MYKIKCENKTFTVKEIDDWSDKIGLVKIVQEIIKYEIGPFEGSIEIKFKNKPERNVLLEIDYVEK